MINPKTPTGVTIEQLHHEYNPVYVLIYSL